MEMSWSTFLLEIVNFLVLVWLLQRFLYRPVLDVVQQRRAGIEKSLADAASEREEAEALHQQYQRRIADAAAEAQRAADALARDIEAERARKLRELRESLQRERYRNEAAEARRRADAMRRLETAGAEHGAQFAARLLQRVASPELEARLIDASLEDLDALPAERAEALRAGVGGSRECIVTSAFPLNDDQRARLGRALHNALATDVPVRFELDPRLAAGVRIRIGAWVLGMNVADELDGFAKLAHGG